MSIFSSGTLTCEAVDEVCRKYRVNRNFEGYSIRKYQMFADILNAHRMTQLTKHNVSGVVTQMLTEMRVACGKLLTSAVTKAFWTMKQHPVVIYDAYAWEGLRRLGLSPGMTITTLTLAHGLLSTNSQKRSAGWMRLPFGCPNLPPLRRW